MSDHGYLLIQAFFQALQLYSWGFAVIKILSKMSMSCLPMLLCLIDGLYSQVLALPCFAAAVITLPPLPSCAAFV